MTQFKCMICGKVDELDKSINDPRYGLICENCNKKFNDRPINIPPSENTCVCCGEVIPEGRHVCLKCEMVAPERGLRQKAPVIDEIAGIVPPLSPEDLPKTCSKPKHTVAHERDSNPVNIHKIIDDAMEKRDRTVSIYIGESGVSVNVYPVDQDKCQWIYHEDCDRYNFECSNCGMDSEFQTTYCHSCGELMHGVRKEKS